MSNGSMDGVKRKPRASALGPKMEDVAREVGVSIITVSRALASPEKVAPETRARIAAAIRKTRYVPNLTAGSLASNKSKIIGAIVPTIDNSIFAATIRALTQTLASNGYQLLLGQSNYDAHEEERLLSTFLGRRVDGLVLIGGEQRAGAKRKIRSAGVPVVQTWDLPANPIDLVSGFSNQAAGAAMARYLLERGYRHFHYLGGSDARSQARLRGFRETIALAGAHQINVITLAPGSSVAQGREGLQAISASLSSAAPKTRHVALFCSNDTLAAGALFECQRRSIRVPDDIGIAGFSDLEIAASLSPALTTIRVPSQQIGVTAAELLLSRLSGAVVSEKRIDLGFELCARESA